MEKVKGEYDYCIIDCPPDINISVINALVAADEVIIPIKIDGYAFDGMDELEEQINNAKRLNPKLKLRGCLVTMFYNREVCRQGRNGYRISVTRYLKRISAGRKRRTRLLLQMKALWSIPHVPGPQGITRRLCVSIWRFSMGGYKNTEGYPDPTAGMAIHEVQKEERRKEHNEAVSTLITMLKQIISLAGFELVGRIVLKDKETGKEYR